jgi:hypothetical protein
MLLAQDDSSLKEKIRKYQSDNNLSDSDINNLIQKFIYEEEDKVYYELYDELRQHIDKDEAKQTASLQASYQVSEKYKLPVKWQ